jgi:hypothetical protein
MAEPRLTAKHLAGPRKLILLVRINEQGDFEAVTLAGEVALVGKTREEIKEKMRVQVRQMKSSVRPTTVRLHFVADQRVWLHAPLPEEAEDGGAPKPLSSARTSGESSSLVEKTNDPAQQPTAKKANESPAKTKSNK